MEISTLASVIIVLCGIKSKNLTDYQATCMDHYNNCMVLYNKEIDPKRLKYCEEKWVKSHD